MILAANIARGGVRSFLNDAAPTGDHYFPVSSVRAFVTLLGVTLVNPTTVVYFAALVVGARAGAVATTAEQFGFVLAAFVASASWQILLAGSGALLGRALTTRRARLVTALVSSAVITFLAAQLAVAG